MIPHFDHNHVLPPHLGSPTSISELSPYSCTTLELCEKFATSNHRIEILKGFLSFRTKMTIEGIIKGFQWLDGSFIENIEKSENRFPNDLDLVTFYHNITETQARNIISNFAAFHDPIISRTNL